VVQSLKAGKAVLVEKPVAVNAADARRMLAASRSTGQLLMVAQVLKFFPEFAVIREGLQKKRWGRLLAFHSRRIICKPQWGKDSWLRNPRLSGGMVIDLHIHDTDFTLNLAGKPKAVTSTGLESEGQVHSIRTTYHYDKKEPYLTSEAGWLNAPSLTFEHGYDAYFEKATVQFNSTHCPTPKLYGRRSVKELSLPKGDGFQSELQAAVDSVKRGKVHPLLSAEAAATSLSVCLAEQKSALTRKRVTIR
jgi:predicted dehydrogenase